MLDEYTTIKENTVGEGFYSEKRSKFLAFAHHVYDADERSEEHIILAQKLYRHGRTRLFHPASLVIHHSTYFTGTCTCGNIISHMQRTLLNQDIGNRSFSFIQFCLNDKTSGFTLRICFQLHHLCCQQDHLQKLCDTFSRMR